ncbi:hypothetical protein [Streptomyces aureus]|uniref:hypothetical protein n=1 Tax=Streptomyces aureus TaxID=193461 RepID=UPI0033DC089B
MEAAEACLCAGPVREPMVLFGSLPTHPREPDRRVDLTGVDQARLVRPELLDASGQWADRAKTRTALLDGRSVCVTRVSTRRTPGGTRGPVSVVAEANPAAFPHRDRGARGAGPGSAPSS